MWAYGQIHKDWCNSSHWKRIYFRGSSHNSRRPSREERMLSDTGITFAGHTITTVQLLLVGGLLLGLAAALLAMARSKRVSLQRTLVTDQIAVDLGRIASALEQIAGETTARRLMEERQKANVTLPPAVGEEKRPANSYSIFGM